MGDPRVTIAKRAAQEIVSGMVVNLGIGIPSMVTDYLSSDTKVFFQAEIQRVQANIGEQCQSDLPQGSPALSSD